MPKRIQYSLRFLILAIIPLIFLFTGLHLTGIFGPVSLRHGDPDYIYLLTGLSMGKLQFDIGHVDNPGTPLQIIVAIVTRITHALAGKGDYFTDVFTRPDFYLRAVITTNLVLIAVAMFYLAYKLRLLIKNDILLMLLQLSFFTGWSVLYDTTIVSPEGLIYIPVSLLIVQLVKYLYSSSEKLSYVELLKFSLICGFGLSIKLDYFPLFFVPIFILKGWKQFAFYLGASFVSFVLFAFTIVKRYLYFYRWVTGLLLHSGKYGMGDTNVINWHDFVKNIVSLFKFYHTLYILLGLVIILLVFSKLKIIKSENARADKILYGLILTISFHTILVAKHFGMSYIVPSVYLIPFLIFLIVLNYSSNEFSRYAISAILICFVFIKFYKEYNGVLQWKEPQIALKAETSKEIRKLVGSKPFMIMDQPYNFYFHESPLLFGWFFQGHYKALYKSELEKLYPATYIFDGGPKKFFLWGDLYTETDILKKHPEIFLFINGSKAGPYSKILDNIREMAEVSCVYDNKDTNNKLYKIVDSK